MRARLIVLMTAALTALAMIAAPAAAHPNAKAGKGIGPPLDGPGAGAHNGIECAAEKNKNLTPLGLDCPGDRTEGPAASGPPDVFEAPDFFLFPDLENEVAVFINTDRATYCSTEVVEFENAVIEWLEGGEVGDPPAEPAFSPGFEPVTFKSKETGQGALVGRINGDDLYIELWTLDDPEDRPFVGPCTDTDDDATLLASGTTSFMAGDNDVFGSDTRASSFGDQGRASLTDGDGNDWTYSWKFHVNTRCYQPLDGPPACLIDRGTLKMK